jgi:hypothetical protein
MKEAIVVFGGLAGVIFVGGELVNNNRDVGTSTRNEIVACASQLKNDHLKSNFLVPLNQGISESDARTLRSDCNEVLSKENLATQLNSTKVS